MKRSYLLALLLLLLASAVYAQEKESVAVVKESNGDVRVLSGGEVSAVAKDRKLVWGDIVRTGPDAHVLIDHTYGFTASLGPNATVRVSSAVFDISGITMARGVLDTRGNPANKDQAFRVATPVAVVGSRGTAFIVVGANSGNSLVGVRQGTVTTGIGQDLAVVKPGQKCEGLLAKGYAPAVSGAVSEDQALAWRAAQDRGAEARMQEVLTELSRLQQKENEDWQEIDRKVRETTQRIMQPKSSEDRLFFRKVFDIEDRMKARRLLAIDLREEAGLTPLAEAEKERVQVQKEWEAQDWSRRAWESAEEGKAVTEAQPEGVKRYNERMSRQMKEQGGEGAPDEVQVLASSAGLFPDVVKGIYIGMTLEEFKNIRPKAATTELAGVTMPEDMPVLYQEKELSGGDWSKEGWFTGMYSFYKKRMAQGTFLAFAGTENLRRQLLEKFVGLYGKPWRHRIEPDWAQADAIKGSTVEWKSEGIEIVVVSRMVPTLKGNTRGLELKVRAAGFGSITDAAGQFSEPSAGIDDQLKKDFPELEGILSKKTK